MVLRFGRTLFCILLALEAHSCAEGGEAANPDLREVFVDWASSEVVISGTCTTDSDCMEPSDCVLSSDCQNDQCIYLLASDGTSCSQGCYAQGKCTDAGVCSGTQLRDCPEVDGNNCTVPQCDLKSGQCIEQPLADGASPSASSECWEGVVCRNGVADESQAQPTEMAKECQAQAESLDPMGCIYDILCVGGEERCRSMFSEDGRPCWNESGETNESDQVCEGFSCLQGQCVVDSDLDVECSKQDLPTLCGAACAECTTLTCHWIDDPANPTNPTKRIRYCRPSVPLGQPCSDDPCKESQACVLGSQGSGPLGKETFGVCGGGLLLAPETCSEQLAKTPLPCVLAGIRCSALDGGCTFDSGLANSWCWPTEGLCFNKETTICSHLSSGPNWDAQTGCDVDWVELDCDDKNDCTVDNCKATADGWGCVHQQLDGVACDDGDLCTTGGQCVTGECAGEIPSCVDDDVDPCNDQSCDPITGECLKPQTDGIPCDDFNACTDEDGCLGSSCQPGQPTACDDHNVCNGVESCNPVAGCQPGDPLVCSNGNLCDGVETCHPTLGCQPGIPLLCGNENLCDGTESCSATEGCKPGIPPVCTNGNVCDGLETCDGELGCMLGVPLVCLDDDVCDGTETCNYFLGCLAGMPLACDDSLPCTTDLCHPISGCSQGIEPDGTACPGSAVHKCVGGECKCVPQCIGLECGLDQCGGSCGTCTSPEDCVFGMCQPAIIDPEGTFTISPAISYSCLGGSIQIYITEVTISVTGSSAMAVLVPTMCSALAGTWYDTIQKVGTGGNCGSGSCGHNYIFSATFTDNDHFTGFFRFTPQDEGMGLCGNCVTQAYANLVGTRK